MFDSRISLIKSVFILFIVCDVLVPNVFAEEKHSDPSQGTVYNFREVELGIYRSGEVSSEALPYLKALGIKTIVSFDNYPKRIQKEEALLKDSGIEFISLPWSGLEYPNDDLIKQIHGLIEDPAKRPILVHCKHGQERTGVVMATWRVAYRDWPVDQAYQEMKFCGFRPFRYGHLKKYVYDFAKANNRESAQIGLLERTKTSFLYGVYQLRKLNLFKERTRGGVGA